MYNGGFVFFTKAGEMAKRTVFLLITVLSCNNVFAATLMDLKSSGATCPFGYYHLKDKDGNLQCVSLSRQADRCSAINGVSTYLIPLEVSSFRYKEYADLSCLGTYSLYKYDTSLLDSIHSRGTFYKVTASAPTCPFGYYHRDGECVKHDTPESQKNCKDGFHKTVVESASFLHLEKEDPVCLGTYSTYAYTNATDDRIYPRYNGTLMYIGSGIGQFKKMKETDCSKNPEHYYSIKLNGIADDYQPFQHPEFGMCDTVNLYHKFIINNDCKDIDTSNSTELNKDKNMLCGVLCQNPGEVYTNSGVCSADGYCSDSNGKHRRIYVGRSGNVAHSYPLYASRTSTPALKFKFSDDQICYVNLVPSQAIEHFVTEVSGPINVAYPMSWQIGQDETEYTTERIITID